MPRALFFSSMIALTLLTATIAQAQQTGRQPFWDQTRAGQGPRLTYTADGYLRGAGAAAGSAFQARGAAGGSPEAIARGFLSAEALWFYDGNPRVAFAAARTNAESGRDYVHLKQTVDGIPVFGAQVMVQLRSGAVEFMLSDILRNFTPLTQGTLRTTALLTPEQAQDLAKAWALREFNAPNTTATAPTLEIYAPEVVGNSGAAALAYVLEVSDAARPLRHKVLVDAGTGGILMHYSLIHDALFRQVYDAANTSSMGTLARSEGGAVTGNPAVDGAYDFLGDTYQFYATENGRDSIDDNGMTLSATVRYCDPFEPCPFANAFWDGSRMWFGDGFQVDDVSGHELTHGVTQYESGLIYTNQSGAINESFSDMWGEWVDLGNGAGNDTPAVRWLMGEDIGAIRNMANPPEFYDPDRMGSQWFYTGPGDDGGVHINSGVGNKLAYLLTDGDTFNSYTIAGMGISLTADLMYECQTNLLTQSSDYGDLYDAITQAAINIGLTVPQRNNLENACRAVEIRFFAPAANFAATSPNGVPQVDLAWDNPTVGSFDEVRIRRSTAGYPGDPDVDGTLIYQGTAENYTDLAVTLGTVYYYSIWAYHTPSGHSLPLGASAQAGLTVRHPTELFSGYPDANDLDFLTVTYTPDGSTDYTMAAQSAYTFPTDPTGGTPLGLDDDDFAQITLSGGQAIPHYGVLYSSFYVSSNGRITFGSPSYEYAESLSAHFGYVSLAALFDDLDPSIGGSISWKQLADRAVVTFSGVPEVGQTTLTNSFQFELFFDGTLRVTTLAINANDGLAGISQGEGIPIGFSETDFTEGATFIPAAPLHKTGWIAAAMGMLVTGVAMLAHRRRKALCSRP